MGMVMTDWQFFWGRDDVPDPDAASDLIAKFDRVLWYSGAGFVALEYGEHGNAWVHTWIAPEHRGGALAFRMIQEAIEQARRDGRRKIIAQIIDGNPAYPAAGKIRGPLGFEHEATLKKHVVLGGIGRDVHIYSLFLRGCNRTGPR